MPRSPNRYLVHGEDLTGSLLHLLQSVHEVPVAGLGSHRVGSEQSHSVDLRLGVRLGGQSAANDLVVVNLHRNQQRLRGWERTETDRQEHNSQAYSIMKLRMAQGIREERERPFPRVIPDSDVTTEITQRLLIPLVATDSIVYSCFWRLSLFIFLPFNAFEMSVTLSSSLFCWRGIIGGSVPFGYCR